AILGPAIVTADEAGDLGDVRIVSRISGEVRVDGSTKNVNISWDELVAFASRLMTLRPGDIITTGMPHGIGEEIMLKPGDTVEGEIERLGVLRNPAVAERSEEHTSELQSRGHLVCRLLLEKKKKKKYR